MSISREFRDAREILEIPQSVENKGESDHCVEILDHSLSFLSCFLLGKGKNHQKEGCLIPTEPQNPWRREEKRSKTRTSSQGKRQGIPIKQGKGGQGLGEFGVCRDSSSEKIGGSHSEIEIANRIHCRSEGLGADAAAVRQKPGND